MSGPRNQDPSIIQDAAEMVGGLLSQYGWFLLLGIAVLCALYYYFQPLLHSRLAAWTQRKAETLTLYRNDMKLCMLHACKCSNRWMQPLHSLWRNRKCVKRKSVERRSLHGKDPRRERATEDRPNCLRL